MSRREVIGKTTVSFAADWLQPLEEDPEPNWDGIALQVQQEIEAECPLEADNISVEVDYDGFTASFTVETEGTLTVWPSTNSWESPDESELTWDSPAESSLNSAMTDVTSALCAKLKRFTMELP